MSAMRHSTNGFGKLEVLLFLSLLALLFQLIPAFGFNVLWAMDVRNWSRSAWLFVNVGVVLLLVGIRYGPELYDDWRQRRARLTIEREKHAKQHELLEQRKLLERLQEARKRRLY